MLENIAIGMIDEDLTNLDFFYKKSQHDYSEIMDCRHSQIKLYKHNTKPIVLLIICPDLEELIMRIEQIDHISLKSHQLPKDHNLLHEFSKKNNSKKLILFFNEAINYSIFKELKIILEKGFELLNTSSTYTQ